MKRKLLISVLLLAILSTVSFAKKTPGSIVKETQISLKSSTENQKKQISTRFESNQSGRSAVKAALTTPFFDSFENETNWIITDDANLMSSGSFSGTAAVSGTYYLTSGYDSEAPRDAWAISNGVTLEGGKTYNVSVWVIAEGWNGVNDEFKITVGTTQDASSQTEVLIDNTGASAVAYATWTKLEVTYTPTTSGDYYFGINHCTSVADVNGVGFDDFLVIGDGESLPPTAAIFMAKGGLWSASSETDDVYLSRGESIDYVSLTTNANSISWAFLDATPAVSTDPSVSVVYNTAGAKTATLEATGDGGTVSTDISLNVIRPASGITDLVWNVTPKDQFALFTVSTNNYVVGTNSYWKRVGEKYTLPSDVNVTLNSISLYVGAYSMTSSTNRNKNVVINIYPVGSDGLPNTTTALGTYTTTFGTLFGSTAITAATLKNYTLPTPLSITGSFFIEVNFSANTAAVSSTNKIGLYSTTPRSIAYNTAYAYYSSAWKPLSDILTNFQVSSLILPNLEFTTPYYTGVDNNTLSGLKVFANKNELRIENASAGAPVNVFDITGKQVYTNVMTGENASFPVDLKSGVYVVKVSGKTTKLVVK